MIFDSRGHAAGSRFSFLFADGNEAAEQARDAADRAYDAEVSLRPALAKPAVKPDAIRAADVRQCGSSPCCRLRGDSQRISGAVAQQMTADYKNFAIGFSAIGLVFVVNGSGGEIALLHAQALQVAAAAIQLGALLPPERLDASQRLPEGSGGEAGVEKTLVPMSAVL